MTMEEIESVSIEWWKKIIKEKSLQITLIYLTSLKGGKTENIEFKEVKMAPFLLSNEEVSIQIAKFIVQIQCRIIREVKFNFKNENKNNLLCNSCQLSECTQSHLLSCQKLIGGNELVTYIPNYEDIFGIELQEQAYIATIMLENLRRKKILENIV